VCIAVPVAAAAQPERTLSYRYTYLSIFIFPFARRSITWFKVEGVDVCQVSQLGTFFLCCCPDHVDEERQEEIILVGEQRSVVFDNVRSKKTHGTCGYRQRRDLQAT
jgi:hypothetical protein